MAQMMNINQLKAFLVKEVGSLKIDKNQAEKLGLDENKFDKADIDDNDYVSLNEIISDADLYGDIAALYASKVADGTVEEEPAEEKKEDKEKVKAGDNAKSK